MLNIDNINNNYNKWFLCNQSEYTNDWWAEKASLKNIKNLKYGINVIKKALHLPFPYTIWHIVITQMLCFKTNYKKKKLFYLKINVLQARTV